MTTQWKPSNADTIGTMHRYVRRNKSIVRMRTMNYHFSYSWLNHWITYARHERFQIRIARYSHKRMHPCQQRHFRTI